LTIAEKVAPEITWSNPADIVYGTALSGTQLDATTSVPGSYSYTPAAGAIQGAGSNQALTVQFTPTDTTHYATASANVHINVLTAQPRFSQLTASQTISAGQATIVVSGTLDSPTATPTGQLVSIAIGSASGQATIQSDGTFSTIIDTHALGAMATPYTIDYSYAGNANFQAASDDSTTLKVNPLPPPPVTMNAVQSQTNKKHEVTGIIVGFSSGLSVAQAQNAAEYRLTTAGKNGSFTGKNTKPITLRKAVYNASNNTVTLIPSKPFSTQKPVQLEVIGVTDSLGRPVVGNQNGTPGGIATAILKGKGATISAVPAIRTQPRVLGSMVDVLAENNDLLDVIAHSSHPSKPIRM
jgi:hypothetical protein